MISLIRTALKTEPGSRFTLLYGNRDSSSVIFLDALADLKDRHMGRFELYHFLAEEAGDVELFNGMLDRKMCGEAIEQLVGDAGAVDEWFICGPGPMMDAAEAALVERAVAKEKIHIERFTADRPSAAVAQEIAALQTKAAGTSLSVTLDGRTRRDRIYPGQYPRQRAGGRAAGAVRLQGGGVRDLPGQGDQRQGRDGGALWPDRRGSRRRLCADLPVGAGRRRRGGRLRRLSVIPAQAGTPGRKSVAVLLQQ